LQNWFRRLFRGDPAAVPVAASTAVETAPLTKSELAAVSRDDRQVVQPAQLSVGVAQSVGLQRDHNEDALFVMHSVLAAGLEDIPFGFFLVADGMGGHLNGEAASISAARTMGEYVIKNLYLELLGGQTPENSVQEILAAAVEEAQQAVLENAPGGGTTLTAALVIGDRVTFAHVGDSRAYFLHPSGRIEVATQDHSLVKRLQDMGQIDEREASVHPQRNVLYRALGQSEPFQADIHTMTMPEDGFLLICSDGLWAYVEESEIQAIVFHDPQPSQACQKLVEAANAAGGPDNISAVLVQYMR
jgi:protein phosphatase